MPISINGTFTGGTWTNAGPFLAKAVTFAIPAGTYKNPQVALSFHLSNANPFAFEWTLLYPQSVGAGYGPIHQSTTGSGPLSWTDTITAVNQLPPAINPAAGGNLTMYVRPLGAAGAFSAPTFYPPNTLTLDSVTLLLDSVSTGTVGTLAVKWAGDCLDGQYLLAWIDTDDSLKVSTHGALPLKANGGTSASADWENAVTLAAKAKDVNCAFFASGRAYVIYTDVDTSGVKTTKFRTNDLAGHGPLSNWSSPQNVAGLPGSGSVINPATLTAPYPPWDGWPGYAPGYGTYRLWVRSPSDSAEDYFERAGSRLINWNSRVYATTYIPNPPYDNGFYQSVDDGATWEWIQVVATSPESSWGDLRIPYRNGYYGRNYLDDPNVGKSYANIVGRLVASPPVRTQHGALLQLVYSTGGNRIVPLTPRGCQLSNNGAGANFDLSSHTMTQPVALNVPADSRDVIAASFHTTFAGQQIDNSSGNLKGASVPQKITFPIPSSFVGTLGLSYVLVMLDFIYSGASNLRVQLGNDSGHTQGITPGLYGRGRYCQGTPVGLTYADMMAVQAAAGGNITLPITISGAYAGLTITRAQLAFQVNYINPTTTPNLRLIKHGDATHASGVMSLNALDYTGGVSVGADKLPETGAVFSATQTNQTLLLADINAAKGSSLALDWQYRQEADGETPASYTYPFQFNLVDGYAVLSYGTGGANPANGDFYCVRSFDNGATWEYANNAMPIAGLNSVRDYNRMADNLVCPVLVAHGDRVCACWVDFHAPRMLLTQDMGETWS